MRWIAGRLGVSERYDIITLDLKSEYMEEAKELPNENIIIDSTFAFDDAKQAYERLVRPDLHIHQEVVSCSPTRISVSCVALLIQDCAQNTGRTRGKVIVEVAKL